VLCPADTLDAGCNPDSIPLPGPDVLLAEDNCGEPALSFTDSLLTDSAACTQLIERTYLATDSCGNTASCRQIIRFAQDTVAPVFVLCPADTLDAGCNPDSIPLPGPDVLLAEDNCGEPALSFTDSLLTDSTACTQLIERTYLATDSCGNTASCSQVIVLCDQCDQEVCPPVLVDLGCNPDSIPGPLTQLSNDTVSYPVTGFTETIDTVGCEVTIQRIYEYDDGIGTPPDSCLQTLTYVNDLTAPVIVSCPADTTLCEVDAVPFDPDEVIAQDDCGGALAIAFADSVASHPCGQLIFRAITVTDACGNASSCVQQITICDECDTTDVCPPLLVDLGCNPDSIPAPLTQLSNDTVSYPVTGFTETIDTVGCRVNINRTYEFIDSTGIADTCFQTITFLKDTVPPVIVGCVMDTIDLGCNPDTIPPPDTLTTQDDCGAVAVEVVETQTAEGCEVFLIRTYLASDVCGNTDSCVQVLRYVQDVEPPVFVDCPADTTYCLDTDTIPGLSPNDVVVSDNCAGPVQINPFEEAVPMGDDTLRITRTYVATDACGNTDSCQQVILGVFNCDDSLCIDYQISFLDLAPLDSLPAGIDCGEPLPDAPELFFLDVFGDTLQATVTIDFQPDSCGYELEYTWTAMDSTCMIDTSISRLLQVNPVLPTLTAPDDIVLFCNELDALPQAIDYTNGLSGPCAISGSISGELELVVGSPECPEEFLETWTLDICDTTLMASRTVKVEEAPFQLNCPSDTLVCGFDEVPPLDTMNIVQAGGCGSIAFSVSVTQDTVGPGLVELQRSIVIADACGQVATCNQIIQVDLLCDVDPFCTPEYIYVPNTFTPNGDRRNDVLHVRSLLIDRGEVEDFEFMIYSGWGEQLFRTTDPQQGWDGTHQGDMLEHGVYGYYVRLRCPGGKDIVRKGNVTLVR